jgi:hypothetical protein
MIGMRTRTRMRMKMQRMAKSADKSMCKEHVKRKGKDMTSR